MPVETDIARRRGRLVFAWAGGVLFVGSLLYFLYFYAVTLGTPDTGRQGPPLRALAINALLFAAFGVHHSMMARMRAKIWFARMAPIQVERATFVWVSSVLLVVVCLAWQRLPGELYHLRGAWAWLLHGVQIAGIGLAMRASGRLDLLDLAGIRQVQHARTRTASAVGLQMSGPYRFVRHPVYLGWVLLVFGAPHMTTDRFALATISTLYLVIAVRFEERALAQAFGASYREYARRVRWRFVPGIY
jgi:methanethiol S-methyltransferase